DLTGWRLWGSAPKPPGAAVPRESADVGGQKHAMAAQFGGARHATVSRRADMVAGDGASSQPRFPARQPLVTRGEHQVVGGGPLCTRLSGSRHKNMPLAPMVVTRGMF